MAPHRFSLRYGPSCRVAVLLVVGLLAIPVGGGGQEPPPGHPAAWNLIQPPYTPSPPRFADHLGAASANALLTGTVAGIRAHIAGESFSRAFVLGSAGGTIGYVGKWTATRDVPGAGWVGRWIHGTGLSVADNGARGAAALSRVILPTGPLRLAFGEEVDEGHVSWIRLDVVEFGGVVWALTRRDLAFDGSATLRRGGFVFDSREAPVLVRGEEVDGWMPVPGVILVNRAPSSPYHHRGDPAARGTLQTLQYDWAQSHLAAPLTGWALDRVDGWNGLRRYLDIDPVLFPLRGAMLGLWGPSGRDTPWGWEEAILFRLGGDIVYLTGGGS